MLHGLGLVGEFFGVLTELDREISRAVAAGGCERCGGPLHQSNYRRKPRGGLLARAGEAFGLRHSLCCGRRGCRKRSLPPSLRFLGRRVYLEVVVVFASVWAQVSRSGAEAAAATGVPRRTLDRWGHWWRETFPQLPTWSTLRARFAPPPPEESTLPESLVRRVEREVAGDAGDARVSGDAGDAGTLLIARLLAPMTTDSVAEGSRFLRGVVERLKSEVFTQRM